MSKLGATAFASALAFAANIPLGEWRRHPSASATEKALVMNAYLPAACVMQRSLGIGWASVPLQYVAALAGQQFGGQLQIFGTSEKRALRYRPVGKDGDEAVVPLLAPGLAQ
eukprot:gene8616-1543_t